jgi:hypothetical protein
MTGADRCRGSPHRAGSGTGRHAPRAAGFTARFKTSLRNVTYGGTAEGAESGSSPPTFWRQERCERVGPTDGRRSRECPTCRPSAKASARPVMREHGAVWRWPRGSANAAGRQGLNGVGRRRDAPFCGHADDLRGSWAVLMCELHQLSVLQRREVSGSVRLR